MAQEALSAVSNAFEYCQTGRVLPPLREGHLSQSRVKGYGFGKIAL